MIHGNTDGIRKSTLDSLETLYEMEVPEDEFLPAELMDKLVRVSSAVNREISVYVSRAGEVIDVTVGGLESVPLPDKRQRRNLQRLAMVRCIHTHPGGCSKLSDVDLSALKSLRLDAIAAVGVLDGRATGVQAAFLGERVAGVPQPVVLDEVRPSRIPQEEWMNEIRRSERRVMEGEQSDTREEAVQRAVLVGVEDETSLAELARLADTAGIQVIGQLLQRREKPDGATYIGSGKAEELSLMCQGRDATMAIFDTELSGAQTRNLEEMLGGVEVVDRTVLILAIFAKRAQSREGRLQVELAQLNYQLPRLTGYGLVMSRIGSGAGLRARGPGETRLELDRRRIRRRVADLQRELEDLGKQRDVRRTRRQRSSVPVVALVGYTNAGKSSLLNRISGAGVLAEDKLFATLDPVTRNVCLPLGGEFLLVDTVGFINKLPHTLVKAFHSTLEEAQLADLLIVVSDASSPELARQHAVVDEVLTTLGAEEKPRVEVLNKRDLCEPERLRDLEMHWPGAIQVCAIDSCPSVSGVADEADGIGALLAAVTERLHALRRPACLLIPYEHGGLLSQLHDGGQILREDYEEDGTRIVALLDDAARDRLLQKLGQGAIRPVPQ